MNLYLWTNNNINSFDTLGLSIETEILKNGKRIFRDTRTGRFRSYSDFLQQAKNAGIENIGSLDTKKLWSMFIVQELISGAANLLYSYAGSKIINSFQRMVYKDAIKTVCTSGCTQKVGNLVRGNSDTTLTTSDDSFLQHLRNAVEPGVPLSVKMHGSAKLIFYVDCKCKKYRYNVIPYTEVKITVENSSGIDRYFDIKNSISTDYRSADDVISACCYK